MLRINWVTTALSSAVLWTFIVWNLTHGDSNDYVAQGKTWVTANWTWFYIITQDLWFMFILYLLFTKYKDLKLGRDDEEPAFSDYEWFSMLFACGIGVGLYKFGVAEPMSYYRGGSSYLPNKVPIVNDDQKAQQALFMTLFHWGLHAWIPYVLVAMVLGIVCYRNGKPMTIRYAFYPLLGENVNGLFGDCIDALSIATTTFGVCTSLGLGVGTILNAMIRLNHNVSNTQTAELLIIWIITAVAATSVVLGLKKTAPKRPVKKPTTPGPGRQKQGLTRASWPGFKRKKHSLGKTSLPRAPNACWAQTSPRGHRTQSTRRDAASVPAPRVFDHESPHPPAPRAAA